MRGIFVISLDFELMWGIRYERNVPGYRANILGVRQAIPAMLNLFREYEIHATWAAVGLLFFSNKADMVRGSPQVKPAYENSERSSHNDMEAVGPDESHDPYHFGYSLIQMVRGFPGQEIGSHTFSHYYCLEPGQDEAWLQLGLGLRLLARLLPDIIGGRTTAGELLTSESRLRTHPTIWGYC